MAAFHSIEFFGIAADRDIVLESKRRRRSSTPSSDISFSSVDVDESLVTSNPIVKSSLDSQPLSSCYDLAPEDCFVQQGSGVSSQSVSDDDHFCWDHVWNYVAARDVTHSGASRMDLFTSSLQRHDEIALSLAKTIPPAQMYDDYFPCPGSGPGTPAMSVASLHEAPPPVIEEPTPFCHQLMTLEIPSEQPRPVASVTSPLARWALDNTNSPWFATVMGGAQPDVPSPEAPGSRQETPTTSITLDGYHDIEDGLPSTDGPIAVDTAYLIDEATRKRTIDSIEADDERLSSLREMQSKRGQGRPRQYKRLRMRQTESPPQKNSSHASS